MVGRRDVSVATKGGYVQDTGILDWPELALRITAYTEGVSCTLVGTTRPEHVRAACAAHARGPLDDAVLERLRAVWDPAWQGLTRGG